MLAQFHYDYAKRMSYKHSSTCHGARLLQKMIYKGQVIDTAKFNSLAPKDNTGKDKRLDVKFRYYCEDCGDLNNGEWEFKRDNFRRSE